MDLFTNGKRSLQTQLPQPFWASPQKKKRDQETKNQNFTVLELEHPKIGLGNGAELFGSIGPNSEQQKVGADELVSWPELCHMTIGGVIR